MAPPSGASASSPMMKKAWSKRLLTGPPDLRPRDRPRELQRQRREGLIPHAQYEEQRVRIMDQL